MLVKSRYIKDYTLKFYPSREDFVQFAKSSKAVKSLVEKQTKVSMKEMARQKSHKNIKIDKALAAFKVKQFLKVHFLPS